MADPSGEGTQKLMMRGHRILGDSAGATVIGER
jgi:hypothetical protein